MAMDGEVASPGMDGGDVIVGDLRIDVAIMGLGLAIMLAGSVRPMLRWRDARRRRDPSA
jgi:hypothetical protein